ncbi:MAG: type II secretion system GspH family protein [Acidobacteriota bacterium]|nr:type II secretion system GspH family protein [Acidobacteriota bacterium]
MIVGCHKHSQGFTLLEVLVATMIMGVAVVTLLSALSTSMHNAARLTDYDRAVMLARTQMDALLLDYTIPLDSTIEGRFTGDSGWRAKLTAFDMGPRPAPGVPILERMELEIWWLSGTQRRKFQLEAYRRDIWQPK